MKLSFKKKLKNLIYESYEKRMSSYNSPLINAKKFTKQLQSFQKYNQNVNFSLRDNNIVSEFDSKGFADFQSKLDYKEFENLDYQINSHEYDKEINIFEKFPFLINIFQEEIIQIIESIYNTYSYIFYGLLVKKIGITSEPTGSELWHSDGGPGTCINLMIVTSELTKESGALELLEFNESKKLLIRMDSEINNGKFSALPRKDQRKIKVKWLNDHIKKVDSSKFYQPIGDRGKVILFRNNTIHRGGFCKKGFYRNCFIFHIYPSKTKVNWDKLINEGIKKTSPIPII